jgi:hypothetical protein
VGRELAVYTMAMGSRGLSESPVAGDELRSEAHGGARRTPDRPAWGASFGQIQLEDFAPTRHELAETTGGTMPEQSLSATSPRRGGPTVGDTTAA